MSTQETPGTEAVQDELVWTDTGNGIEKATIMAPVIVTRFRGEQQYLFGLCMEAATIESDETRVNQVLVSMGNPFHFGFMGDPGPDDTNGSYLGSITFSLAIQHIVTTIHPIVPAVVGGQG